MGKSLSMLIEERRDLKNDLKSLRRNRLYLNERIDECVKGIKKIDVKIEAWRSPVDKAPVEEIPEVEVEVEKEEEKVEEEDVEEEEKPKRRYTPRKKVEEEEE